jgi:DNA-directed RNA polymerase specialized sigma24 family protein
MTPIRETVDDARALAAVVAQELRALPGRQAEALRLAYEHRLTHAEIATRLGTSLDETKQIIAVAMRAIAQRLGTV